ncbi:GNAT family N-acetyltransferase [Anoxynatronum buryatiense]|uniref:Predicted acetyltransferase n=1 Tax=Anoxynatronum buryatiense TaxID=489973 RepID=A0AA45WSY4_9CLOT|nr:GNAT family N-acetyltransferase [Anoxynatronum buryatiense]SMP39256.1 Predicted acetyltransferase [Anoxynatronum buryatiense]
MREIRLLKDSDAASMARLMVNAYPGYDLNENARATTEDWVRKYVKNGADDVLAGQFTDEGTQIGGIRMLTQPINLRMKQLTAIGLGALCVDLLHKKEKVALKLLTWAFEEGRQKGAALAVLDPFNIGFYKKLGCGLGAVNHQFWLTPSQFPAQGDRTQVVELSQKDLPEIMDYYRQFFQAHHGVLRQETYEVEEMLKGCQMVVGVRRHGRLTGIMAFHFQRTGPDNLFKTNLLVEELLFDDADTLLALAAMIHAQADQVSHVRLRSQQRNFEAFFDNPDTGNDDTFHTRKNEMYRTGNGMMYRVLDIPKVLETLQPNEAMEQRLVLKLQVADDLIPANHGDWYLWSEDGIINISRDQRAATVTLSLSAGDLASLVMGSVGLASLVAFGKATLNEPQFLKPLHHFFDYPEAPICLSRF